MHRLPTAVASFTVARGETALGTAVLAWGGLRSRLTGDFPSKMEAKVTETLETRASTCSRLEMVLFSWTQKPTAGTRDALFWPETLLAREKPRQPTCDV